MYINMVKTSSLYIAKKKDSDAIRICIDPKNLNEAIQREHYPMRTFEEVIARMPNAQYFTTLDASHGFGKIPLDHLSSLTTTFNTPYGRYFKRLALGLSQLQGCFGKQWIKCFVVARAKLLSTISSCGERQKKNMIVICVKF